MNDDLDHGHPGDLNTVLRVTRHCYGGPNIYISICPVVGLPPIGGEADGQEFQCFLCLGTQQAIHRDNKEVKFSTLLKASV